MSSSRRSEATPDGPSATACRSPDVQAIRKYFETVYPPRQASSKVTLFRRGEADRIATVRKLLRDSNCTKVLDVGCGDGFFLDAVLPPYTEYVRVEDIVPSRLVEAVRRVKRPNRVVESGIADVNDPPVDDTTFDVVMAIGVLDYNPDWHAIVPRLLRRAHGMLIVDFPNVRCAHARQRALWLRSHGVKCRFVSRFELDGLVAPYGLGRVVESSPYNWLVLIPATTRR